MQKRRYLGLAIIMTLLVSVFLFTEFVYGSQKISLQIDGIDAEHAPRLDGSLANEPLILRIMMELTEKEAEDAELYLEHSFKNGGTSTCWYQLFYGRGGLVISYEPPQEIKEEYREELRGLEINSLGRDGLVFIVNINNPVESLTIEQIRDIYSGKITDWEQVGGNPGEIRAFQRNATSGSQTLLNKLVMDGIETMEPEKEYLVGHMGGLIDQVAQFDGNGSAIGFSVYYYADRMKNNPNLKMLSVEGISPSTQSITDGSYPLCNDFYVAIRAEEEENSPIRHLRDWLLSEDGKTLLEEEGYVWAGSPQAVVFD